MFFMYALLYLRSKSDDLLKQFQWLKLVNDLCCCDSFGKKKKEKEFILFKVVACPLIRDNYAFKIIIFV